MAGVIYAGLLFYHHQHDRAIEQYRKALDVGVPWWTGRPGLGMVLTATGRFEEAIQVIRQAMEQFPDAPEPLADLAYVLAAAGDREEAVALLDRAKQDGPEPFNIARAYVALNQPDSAFAWLRRSPWQWPHRANRFDPALDPLRADPRFEELSARVERDLGIR